MISLNGVKRIGLDTETTGLDRHGSDLPVGVSIASPVGDAYYAFGHPEGNNCTLEQVQRWAKNELPGRQISLVNPSFDLHMLKKAGIDLEAIGALPRGVQYKCALLDEKRRHYSLDSMSQDYLGKSKAQNGALPENIHSMPGRLIADYAILDARLTLEIDEHFEPLLDRQGLQRVAQLEDDLIYCVLHMECQGVILDTNKLQRWDTDVSQKIQELEKGILLGVNPRSGPQLEKAFKYLGFESFTRTEKDKPCFDENALKAYRLNGGKVAALCDHLLTLRAVSGLKSRYTSKYLKEVGLDGLIRYNLHQCRTSDNGTVSGRFSASNINIQQVSAPEKQDPTTSSWIIRELFLPEPGSAWLSGDASQIEFRLFAHYSGSSKLVTAYQDNPDTDFHQVVAELTGLIRKLAKNVNFGMVYGMGQIKLANDLQLRPEQADSFFSEYHRRFPEARKLMNKCMRIARQRGFVKTLLGRRRRFTDGHSLHSALNAVLQGSAADIMKKKMVAVYRERKNINFNPRFVVHDEFDGDAYGDPLLVKKQLKELLDIQDFNLSVPILWRVKTGSNWREAS